MFTDLTLFPELQGRLGMAEEVRQYGHQHFVDLVRVQQSQNLRYHYAAGRLMLLYSAHILKMP